MTLTYATRFQRDVRRTDHAAQRRIRSALEALAAGGTNLDVVVLVGRAPWRRLRVGEYRVIFRPLDDDEGSGYLIARVVTRGDLETAVAEL